MRGLIDAPLFERAPFDPNGPAAASITYNRMVAAAASEDWASYIQLAKKVGVFAPRRNRPRPPSGANPFSSGAPALLIDLLVDQMDYSPPSTALEDGLAAAPDPSAALASLAAWAPKILRGPLLDTLLTRAAQRELSFMPHARRNIAALLALGANPSLAARQCVDRGDVGVLDALLAGGLDPNQGTPPLLLAALDKDRAVANAEKLAAAGILWRAGARLDAFFASRGGPRSVLELGMANFDRALPTPGRAIPPPCLSDPSLASFAFMWASFDVDLVPLEAILPAPEDLEGNARVAAMIQADANLFQNGRGWASRAEGHSWLQAAFDICQLRAQGSSLAAGSDAGPRRL